MNTALTSREIAAMKALPAAIKAENEAYSQGIWKAGSAGGSIVTDQAGPGCGPMDEETRTYYGGYLIAESISPANKRRILACVNACAGITTEQLESCAHWSDIVKAPLQHCAHIPAEAARIGAGLDPASIEQAEVL